MTLPELLMIMITALTTLEVLTGYVVSAGGETHGTSKRMEPSGAAALKKLQHMLGCYKATHM